MASSLVFLVFLLASLAAAVSQKSSNKISMNSSLSPRIQPAAWFSPSGRFAFGFYPEGSGFAVGIWLVGISERTVVWTDNRNNLPVSSNATLELIDGMLLLRSAQSGGKIAGDSAAYASMLDSGNFVLYSDYGDIIWESFKFPTDTLLSGQNLSSGFELVSSFSKTNHSTGRFCLKMQVDGNLVLYPINTSPRAVDAYWASNTDKNSTNHLYLTNTGVLQLMKDNSPDVITKQLTNPSPGDNNNIICRATLGDDGNFRLYSHSFESNGYVNSSVNWQALQDTCQVKNFCGFNSYCTHIDEQPGCLCLPGGDFIDNHQRFYGCARNFTKESCKNGKENSTSYIITKMENLELDDTAYFKASKTTEEYCSKSCLEDCDCDAALFDSDFSCKKYKFPVKYAWRRSSYFSSVVFVKVGNRSIESGIKDIPVPVKPLAMVTSSKKTWMLILVISLGLVTYSFSALAFSGFFFFRSRDIKYRTLLETGTLGLTEDLTLRSYTYKELMKATKDFKEELGKGSFGTVYKGCLYKSKKQVAVKRLEKAMTDEGEREFQAEMLVIGRTHHKNLVRLLGYCAEGVKRLLVYEFMSNGTLADLLFRSERRPDWSERVRIALDIARGILYLHEECEAPIIHCDIKPHNVLMDDFWTAKISDFGLAKLLMPDQTRTFTTVRGTRGYLAPEWHQNTPISVKVDIFSFGMMLLEIVCCRRNLEVHDESKPEEIVLSSWAYKCLVAGELNKLVGGEQVDKMTLERMVIVGLWCIQDEPALRPSIKSVVLMLEGMTNIVIPPPPTSSSF